MVKSKIEKILVPIDGSKDSLRGLDMAINLAQFTGATITGIFSIYSPPHSEFVGVRTFEKELTKEVKKIMNKAKKTSSKNGVAFKTKIVSGDTGYNIITTANKGKFDLIVIGSRGRSSVKELFLGSVSNYVIHSSKIPVLVVK